MWRKRDIESAVERETDAHACRRSRARINIIRAAYHGVLIASRVNHPPG